MILLSDVKGKEVVNNNGDIIGVVKDFEINDEYQLINLVIMDGTIANKIGIGEDKIIPIASIQSIKDKIIIEMI